jgi:hypothetical protein
MFSKYGHDFKDDLIQKFGNNWKSVFWSPKKEVLLARIRLNGIEGFKNGLCRCNEDVLGHIFQFI